MVGRECFPVRELSAEAGVAGSISRGQIMVLPQTHPPAGRAIGTDTHGEEAMMTVKASSVGSTQRAQIMGLQGAGLPVLYSPVISRLPLPQSRAVGSRH